VLYFSRDIIAAILSEELRSDRYLRNIRRVTGDQLEFQLKNTRPSDWVEMGKLGEG
jgi:hypothetical protein